MKRQHFFLKTACTIWIICINILGQNAYSQSRKNAEEYTPNGITMIYVEGNDSVKGFYIGKYEITQAQWKEIMGNNPSYFRGDSLPVENVSWNEVKAFLVRLNSKTDRHYRLPTEKEWEYAAKGGLNNDSYEYSGSNMLKEVAWYWDNSGRRTHAVGTKKPNTLGIYDMSGNVWEWCEDFFDNKNTSHTARGGSWYFSVNGCRLTNRNDFSPDEKTGNLGFRVVLP